MSEQGSQDIRSQLSHSNMSSGGDDDEQRLYQRNTEATRESDAGREGPSWPESGLRDLARAALERSARHAAQAAQYLQQYLEQKQYVEHMKIRLLDLETRARQPSPSLRRSTPSDWIETLST